MPRNILAQTTNVPDSEVVITEGNEHHKAINGLAVPYWLLATLLLLPVGSAISIYLFQRSRHASIEEKFLKEKEQINKLHQKQELKNKEDTREELLLLKQEIEKYRVAIKELETKNLSFTQKNLALEAKYESTTFAIKSQHLSAKVDSNVERNEALIRIKTELARVYAESGEKLPKKHYMSLLKEIDIELGRDENWKIIETNFNKTYPGFFDSLKFIHEKLTPNDLKLCAYLRINLSSKDIAPLLNISVRSVEVSRYRLRKKMDIPHDKNLIEYMEEIA